MRSIRRDRPGSCGADLRSNQNLFTYNFYTLFSTKTDADKRFSR